ncbi:putative endopeptidase precursor [Streptomyces sp. YIM 121038]|uniref:C40 family peptidase n=1 Tax=Streptomyces sp. YIM 121038 TaxID=2136401 RepID=UPI0011100688|nr:C40 family peptidase [Streptomyces sp. YIM 121038]QCX78622.1 putative endopeptidase precursor [Streptomyces sp. YIM 121038]
MAQHRKPKQRSLSGHTARTAATLALASAATATAFEGTGHAEPRLTPGEVQAKVDRLYREAEVATEKYNGAKEKADRAEESLRDLRDEAARKTERLNSARQGLGSLATAQYRAGAVDPSVQLALSADPDAFLDRATRADRAGRRQAAEVADVRRQVRELDQLHTEADDTLGDLKSRQADLRKHKKTVTGKLGEAKRLLARLTADERARLARAERGEDGPGTADSDGSDGSDGSGRASRDDARGAAPAGAVKAPDSRAAKAVSYAYKALGSPYVWGATGPNAFDCSGLTQAAYRAAGVSLPRTTYAQIDAGRRVGRSELQPGDLVFFYSGISHVGLYVGNGQMIHAPNPSAPVRLAPIDQMPFAGATRVA